MLKKLLKKRKPVKKKTVKKKKVVKKKAVKKKVVKKKAVKKKTKRKASKNAFGNYRILPDEALGKIIGTKPLKPSEMTKKIWQYIKRRKLSNKK